ncbi:hypothetical protein V3C99_001351 [Haemonchus contortus]
MTVVAAEYRLPRTGTLALRSLSSKADSMLVHIWLTISFTIAITQLLVTSQPEWIVSRDQILGLFALCNPWGCEFREINGLLPLVLHLMDLFFFCSLHLHLFLPSSAHLRPNPCKGLLIYKSLLPLLWGYARSSFL